MGEKGHIHHRRRRHHCRRDHPVLVIDLGVAQYPVDVSGVTWAQKFPVRRPAQSGPWQWHRCRPCSLLRDHTSLRPVLLYSWLVSEHGDLSGVFALRMKDSRTTFQ